ncbi:ABC transporter ATP-binding protein [Streptomyces candidus]|uniref:ABC-2 type transport system ATP-binding protein n=1 Tax=Streptomyces candidus TaxID=67283 RepID=A0A7X0HCN2_9ACTN|nr:ATP-binding cassette domain-containing protein [Streptomyces candidus]MBB6435129.1 ABC-2 type transport system ATP-binding protein [Streptomyces candidus]GHH40753.1 lantibiotic ABC transporter ATP-binding protein [Streptomyces candidus]
MVATNDAVLEVRQLHKHYGTHRALDGVDLTVSRGEVYGLLGPNGAGKTTLMKAVLGLQRPTAGTVRLFGGAVGRETLAQVGALIEVPGLWPTLTGDETLRLHARLRCVPEQWTEPALELVKMTGARHRKVGAYSLGMRWRLGIAVALLARPRLLILDEPTNGLDPVGIREMRGIIRSLADEGVAVLIASHQLAEVAQVCDRVQVVVAGRTRYEGLLGGLAVDGDLEAGFFRLLETADAAAF